MITTQANDGDKYSGSDKGCSYCSYTIADRKLPESPTTNIRMTSPGLLTPTTRRVAMMTVAMTTGQKARGPSNFVSVDQITPYATDQTFCLKISHVLIFFLNIPQPSYISMMFL